MHIPYQNLLQLANIYDVSMDYICGLTLHRKYREMEIDALHLTDGSVEFLKNNKNVRVLNELLSCKDFSNLLNATELFVAGNLTAGINDMNAVFAIAEQTLKSKFTQSNEDEVLSILEQANMNESEYLRFRITERFNEILKHIFDHRKKEEVEHMISVSQIMKENLDEYLKDKSVGDRKALDHIAHAMGIDITMLTNEKLEVLLDVIKESDLYKMSQGNSSKHMSREQRRKMQKMTGKK